MSIDVRDVIDTNPDRFITYVQPTPTVPLLEVPLKQSDGVAIVSGGMDSITMVYHLLDQKQTPHLVSFDYGQRHKKELDFAQRCAERKGLHWSLVDLSSITDLIATSALTHGADVPEGHYAEDNMALTVVPNRNMMMASIATAIAVSEGGWYIATGVHSGDHAQYPDCRPEFVDALQTCVHVANKGFIDPEFQVVAPFLYSTKAEIASEALFLGVPLNETWSCYKGGDKHCGRCGTCVERLEAIDSVHVPGWDTTEYEDTEFWREAVAEFQNSQ